jgi:hypothetical protein
VRLDNLDGAAGVPAVAAGAGAGAAATAVWTQHDGVQNSVYMSRFIGGTWSAALLVEDQTAVGNASAGGASNAQVAMGVTGRTVMTWTHDDGNANFAIWGNVYDPIQPTGAGLAFDSAKARKISTGGNASDAMPAFDGSGFESFVVWTQFDEGRLPMAYRIAQVQYQFVPCGELVPAPCSWNPADYGWRSVTYVELNPNDAIAPQVAGFGTGAAAAVWPQATGPFGVIPLWASSYSKTGGWGVAVQLDPGSNNVASSPVVAASADGSAVATWIETVGTRHTARASRMDASGGWSAPVAIDDTTASASDSPQVTLDQQGNALFAWIQSAGGQRSVYARRCPGGVLSTCAAAVNIESSADGAESLHLAGTATGAAVAAWTHVDSLGQRRIVANQFDAATSTWAATVAPIDSNAGGARLAIDPGGNATLVWSKVVGSRTQVYASRLE